MISVAKRSGSVDNYKAHIPVMWNHPGVAGITIWGYIYGSTWVEGTGLIRNGQERPALVWLKEFIKDNLILLMIIPTCLTEEEEITGL